MMPRIQNRMTTLLLGPAQELEMMVERRHPEDALPPADLEIADLEDDGQALEDEHAGHGEEEQLLLDEDGDRGERRAERERPDVAHEDLGRMGVEPHESEAGAGQGAGEDRQLRGRLDLGDEEVVGEDGVAGDVGQRGQGRGADGRQPDGQPVQSVGHVHRVRGADQNEGGPGGVEPAEVGQPLLDEGEVEVEVESAVRSLGEAQINDDQAEGQGQDGLEQDLVPGDQAQRPPSS